MLPALFTLFNILFCYPRYLMIPFFLISVKYAIEIFIEIALNLQISLGRMDMLTIFSFPIHEHGISFIWVL